MPQRHEGYKHDLVRWDVYDKSSRYIRVRVARKFLFCFVLFFFRRGNPSLVPRPHRRRETAWYSTAYPRSQALRNAKYTRAWRAGYIFSRDHDVIKIGPQFLEQKGNVLGVIQPVLRSTLGVYDIRPPIVIYIYIIWWVRRQYGWILHEALSACIN